MHTLCPEDIPRLPPLDEIEDGEPTGLDEIEDGEPTGPDELVDECELPLYPVDDGPHGEDSSELDVGIDLPFASDEDHARDAEIVLDIGELLTGSAEEDGAGAADDRDGPADADGDLGILTDFSETADTGEGPLDEPMLVLVDETLPELDADDGSARLDEQLVDLCSARDDPPPPPAARLWGASEPLRARVPLRTVAARDGEVVAGGSDLLWFAWGSSEGPRRLSAGTSSVRSLALLSAEADAVLYATVSGSLSVRGRLSDSSRRIRGFESLAHPLGALAEVIVARPTTGSERWLLRTELGGVLLSDDAGVTWRLLELAPRANALAAEGAIVCAVSSRPTSLYHSSDGGSSFARRELSAAARAVASAPRPLLAVAGDVIALADEASGLVVARGTEEFVHIEGCAGATALAVGCLGSQVCIWVALHRESEERTDLALLDADSLVARCIGSIAVKPRAEHDVDASERVRVQALTWDSVGGRLWAVGDFGTRSFAPMPGLSQAPPERDG